MTKKKDIFLLIEGFRRISDDFTALADVLEGKSSNEETEQASAPVKEAAANEAPASEAVTEKPVEEATPTEPESPAYTLQDVRKILADQSRKGYTDKVKAILEAHGAEKLSSLPESEYATVVKEAEALDG